MPTKDKLYAQPKDAAGDFVFDENVAGVFEDMINRSVPGYAAIISMIGCLAKKHVQPESRCYDLGCSLGAASLAMRSSIEEKGVTIIAVDNSQAMADKCRANVEKIKSGVPVEVICADMRDIPLEDASMVVLNFAMQFVKPGQREGLLKGIYKGMRPGGILVLSEKIAFSSPEEQSFQAELHHTFKKLKGYSDLEIAQKRAALEKILIPETLDTHKSRLHKSGFQKTYVWFQSFNFVSMVAFK